MKRILLVVLMAGLYSCSSKDKSEAAEFFERANYHFKKRDYDKALEFYTEAIEKVPNFADAYNNRGTIYEKLGKMDLALQDYKQAMDLDDEFDKAKINWALAKIHSGSSEGVEEVLEKLNQSHQDSARFQNALGQLYLLKGKVELATVSLQKSLVLGEITPEKLTNIGYAYYLQRDWKQARTYFEQAIETDSEFAFAYNNLSATLGQLNLWNDALGYSAKAIEKEPQNIIFINTHSLNLLETGNLDEAEEFIAQALKIEPSNNYALRNKALQSSMKGNTKEAIELFESILAQSTDVEYLYFYLAEAYKLAGDLQKACGNYEKGAFIKDKRCITAYESC